MKSILFALLILVCCFVNCTNSNADQLNSYKTNPAKLTMELAKQLAASPGSFSYKFDSYFVKNSSEYINISINKSNFTAIVPVLVNNWKKLEGIKKSKGMGYSGAELKGLELAVVKNSDHINFVYKNVAAIID